MTEEVLTTTKVAVEKEEPPKKKRGRPSKKLVEAKKKGNRGVMGRPKGDAAIMNEYKARMLASPKSQRVLQKVFDVALDDDHKNQAACMKMVIDRIAPVSSFEKDVVRGAGRNAITVNITGVGTASVQDDEDIIEAEFDD